MSLFCVAWVFNIIFKIQNILLSLCIYIRFNTKENLYKVAKKYISERKNTLDKYKSCDTPLPKSQRNFKNNFEYAFFLQ